MEKQLDYDVIPADSFREARVENGILKLLDKSYACLVLPYAQYLDARAVQFIEENQKNGLKVYVIDRLPEGTTKGEQLPPSFEAMVEVTGLKELAGKVAAEGEIRHTRQIAVTDNKKEALSSQLPDLRLMVNQMENGLCVMLFNESVSKRADFSLLVKDKQLDGCTIYDPWNNQAHSFTLKAYSTELDEYAYAVPLRLEPGESCFLCLEPVEEIRKAGHTVAEALCTLEQQETLLLPWRVCASGEGELVLNPEEQLPNLNSRGYFPKYTGSYLYSGSFVWHKEPQKHYMLNFPEASDCIRVTLNGTDLGYLAGFPARVDITEALQDGENRLELKVDTTLVWKLKDGASTHLQLPASGITEAPVLETWCDAAK
jgi:hypothetical protein